MCLSLNKKLFSVLNREMFDTFDVLNEFVLKNIVYVYNKKIFG